MLSPIFLFSFGSNNIELFKSSNIVKNDYVIRVIGSNIDLDRFYGNSDTIEVINDLVELSQPQSDQKTQKIFLWPEGIIPNINQAELKQFEFLFNEKFNKNHLLAIGITSYEKKNNKEYFYNTFSIYDRNLNLIKDYKKVKLVPFGEFLPFEKILKKIGLRSITNNYQSFSSGKIREPLSLKEEGFDLEILPLICYEIIYSGNISQNSKFDYIINVSEDGWFGNSIGPHQHFAHSVFRAIESGKYILRSANNGITAIINPTGNVENKIELGQSGYIDFDTKKVFSASVFSKYGNKMFLIIILLYIFLIFSFNRIR